MTMSEKSGLPPCAAWVSPYLTVKDPSASIEFYERAFGFSTRGSMPGPDGKIVHAGMNWNDGVIMFGAEAAFGGTCRAPVTSGVESPIALYVYCDDVDALFARATEAGAQAVLPPQNQFWGDRMCRLIDPDGYAWCFATHVGKAACAEELVQV